MTRALERPSAGPARRAGPDLNRLVNIDHPGRVVLHNGTRDAREAEMQRGQKPKHLKTGVLIAALFAVLTVLYVGRAAGGLLFLRNAALSLFHGDRFDSGITTCAYESHMVKHDLHMLHTAQEGYRAEHGTYAPLHALGYEPRSAFSTFTMDHTADTFHAVGTGPWYLAGLRHALDHNRSASHSPSWCE